MRSVLAIAAVELRRFWRDRANIFFVFVFPMLLVILIGSQFGGGGSAGRVAIAGPDSDLRSRIAGALRAEDVEVWYDDAGTVRDELARNRADVGVFLTGADDRAFAAGEDVDVPVVVSSKSTAQGALQRVRTAVGAVTTERSQVAALSAAGLSESEARTALSQAAASAPAPKVSVTDVDKISQEFGDLGQFDIGAATQTLLFVFLSTLTGASALIQSRREGVLSRIVAQPVSAGQAVAGQALGRFTLAMVQGLYLLIGTAVLFGVDWGSWPATLLVLAAFAAVASALAMIIGSVMDNEGAATGVGIGAGLVLAALGGCMTPLEFFPATLQKVAHVTPHAWAYDAFAEIQRHGGGVLDVLPQLGVLLTAAAVLLAVGAMTLRRSIDRAL